MKQNIQVHVITAKQEKLCKLVRVILTCYVHLQVRVYVGRLNLSNKVFLKTVLFIKCKSLFLFAFKNTSGTEPIKGIQVRTTSQIGKILRYRRTGLSSVGNEIVFTMNNKEEKRAG